MKGVSVAKEMENEGCKGSTKNSGGEKLREER